MSIVLADLKLAPAVREFLVDLTGIFKDCLATPQEETE